MRYDPNESGQRIQMMRKEKGLTQEEVAEALNISPSLYAKIEIGYRSLSITNLVLLADFYSTTTDYILFGTEMEKEKIRQGIQAVMVELQKLDNDLRDYHNL